VLCIWALLSPGQARGAFEDAGCATVLGDDASLLGAVGQGKAAAAGLRRRGAGAPAASGGAHGNGRSGAVRSFCAADDDDESPHDAGIDSLLHAAACGGSARCAKLVLDAAAELAATGSADKESTLAVLGAPWHPAGAGGATPLHVAAAALAEAVTQDAPEAAALADAWNELEAFVLETRSSATTGPLAADLQPALTLPLLAAAEEWMLDSRDSGDHVPLADVRGRLDDVRAKLHELAPGYFAKLAAQKAALEVRHPTPGPLGCTHRTRLGLSPWPGLTLSSARATPAARAVIATPRALSLTNNQLPNIMRRAPTTAGGACGRQRDAAG
jgi:hypothetical protein